LYVPVLTYVFGEAQLDGRCAVISFHRLDETFYGFPPNPRLLEERLHKEAVHELGHTYGLLHCQRYDCVMHSSMAVEEVDVRPINFCSECAVDVNVQITAGGNRPPEGHS
jgi:archaemetzincin